MANKSVLKISWSIQISSTSIPPLFLAPALQSLPVTSQLGQPQSQSHSFTSTPCPQARPRHREKNKSRGVSAIRRTGPRVPLSVSKYPLPMPVHNPPLRKEFKTRKDHGLWGFFNEERTAMTTPEDLNAHGRSWTYAELANKHWLDLFKLWWMCVRERNWLETEALERKRREAGYGDYEGEHREKTVKKTMREIRRVLTDRSRSFQDALKMSGSEEFWKEILTQEQKQDGENILLEDDDGKGVFEKDKPTEAAKSRMMEEEQQLGGVDGGSGSGAPPAQLLRETEPMRKEAELR